MSYRKYSIDQRRKTPLNKPYVDWKIREWLDDVALKQEKRMESFRKDHYRSAQIELFSADATYSVRYADAKDYPSWVFRER